MSAAAAPFTDGEAADAGPGESFDDDDGDEDATGASIEWVVRTAVEVGREVGPCGRPDGIAGSVYVGVVVVAAGEEMRVMMRGSDLGSVAAWFGARMQAT